MVSGSSATNMLTDRDTVIFHWVQKLLGLAPFTLTDDKYSVQMFMSLYTAIFFGLMSAFTTLCSKEILTVPGVSFSSYVTLLCTILTLLYVILRQSAAVNAHNEIISVSYALKKFTHINYRKLYTVRVSEFVFSLSLVTCISVFQVQSSEQSEWYSCMGMIYALVIRAVMANQFIWMTHTINMNLTAVNELMENEQIYMSDDLIEVAHLHERLTSCGEMTNDAYSVALLGWAIESFTKICYCSYHLTVCTLSPDYYTCGAARSESFFALLWYLIQLWYTIRLCQMMAISAASTATIIHEILRNVETSEAVVDKLEKFSFQLVAKFVFNASGFFDIDYTFLTTLAGLITTYVIIFVQFFVMDNPASVAEVLNVHELLDRLPETKN